MAETPDEELSKNLKAARKKARNFVMVLKGTRLVGLIVSKKSIKAGEKAAAKAEFKGNAFVEGVVVGEGAELVFKIQGAPGGEPGVKIAQFKDFVDEQAGMKIKPRFEMVSELQVVDENEEEGSENEEDEGGNVPNAPPPPQSKGNEVPPAPIAPPPPQSKGNEVPPAPPAPPPPTQNKGNDVPPSPPPAPPSSPTDEMKGLIAAMNKLSDQIKDAAAKNPNQKGELLKHVAAFQAQAKSGDAQGAKASLLAVGTLLKQLSGTSPVTPPPAPPVAPSPPESSSQVPPAPTPPSPPESSSQVPPAPTPPPPDRAAVDWEREFARIEPRYLEALKTSTSDAASKLRVVFTYATEQAEARAFDKALGALKRLEPLLDAVQQAPSGGPAGEIEKGIVEKRKFMLTRMKAIPGEIQPSLNKLKDAITREVPEENADELAKAIESALKDFYAQIQEEIDDAINAGNSKILAGLKNRVLGNQLIEHLYTNPLAEGAAFRDSLIDALDEIEQKLAS
jgi:hypothetical protein